VLEKAEEDHLTNCVKKKYYMESRRNGTSYIHCNEGRIPELVTSCLGTAF